MGPNVSACVRGTPSQALWVFLWCLFFKKLGFVDRNQHYLCGVDEQDTVNPLSLLHPPPPPPPPVSGSIYKEIGHWLWLCCPMSVEHRAASLNCTDW